jgi:CheY-like chemotaxis protein
MGGQTKRILVVDDHDDTRKATALMLTRAGYDVRAVGTIAEAMKLCDAESFDLLLGDVGLPDGSGLDLMRILAARCGLKGIAYTGYGYEADKAAALAAGFSAHLLKPVDVDVLLRTIQSVLVEANDEQFL